MYTKQIGNFGERIAENYLKEKNYKILDRNFVFIIPGNPQKGELDIVAKKGDVITFIEVKTLRGRGGTVPYFLPEEKVNFGKQRKLRISAESWLMKNKIPLNSKWQIDVISIKINSDKKVKIEHFENAISYL